MMETHASFSFARKRQEAGLGLRSLNHLISYPPPCLFESSVRRMTGCPLQRMNSTGPLQFVAA